MEQKTDHLQIRISPEFKKVIKQAAADERLSVACYLERLVWADVKAKEKAAQK